MGVDAPEFFLFSVLMTSTRYATNSDGLMMARAAYLPEADRWVVSLYFGPDDRITRWARTEEGATRIMARHVARFGG